MVLLPGRLGTPDMVLREDPRVDPRIVGALARFRMDGALRPSQLAIDASMEELYEYFLAGETGSEAMFGSMSDGVPPVDSVDVIDVDIEGVGGHRIELRAHRPAAANGVLPCVVHVHGGGMAMLSVRSVMYERWRNELAATGLVVIGVEFRNSAGALGNHPFPAGLNDCAAAVRYVCDNKAELGVSTVVVSGESGGGNLSLATALKANREGWADRFDGVYAQCPCVSNEYKSKPAELVSMHENDGYFLTCVEMARIGRMYDPDVEHSDDPLCWPYLAEESDLRGLPPHVISVNELDLLRDEGLAYFRKLLDAGVEATSRTVNGTTHAADVIFRADTPDIYAATIRDIHGFVTSV
jgi:acetyl esterase